MMQTLVLGIGNAWRGDDAVGLLAAHALRERALPDVSVVETTAIDPALIELFRGVDRLVVIDAVISGAAPGSVRCFDFSLESPPRTFSFDSCHAFDLVALLDLARVLGRLPPQVWVFGIEVADFSHGQPVSKAVMSGVRACVAAVGDLLTSDAALVDNQQIA